GVGGRRAVRSGGGLPTRGPPAFSKRWAGGGGEGGRRPACLWLGRRKIAARFAPPSPLCPTASRRSPWSVSWRRSASSPLEHSGARPRCSRFRRCSSALPSTSTSSVFPYIPRASCPEDTNRVSLDLDNAYVR